MSVLARKMFITQATLRGFIQFRPDCPVYLPSGDKSPHYVDITSALLHASTCEIIRGYLVNAISECSEVHYVGGPDEWGALLVSLAIADASSRDISPLRKGFLSVSLSCGTAWRHHVRGHEVAYQAGVVVLTDVIASGAVLLPILNYISVRGAYLRKIITVFDRSEEVAMPASALSALRQEGKVVSLFTAQDLNSVASVSP
jgi:orotate phosphoribosyltransferase